MHDLMSNHPGHAPGEDRMKNELHKEFLEYIMKHYDPTELLLYHGMVGLLQEFEKWLEDQNYIAQPLILEHPFKQQGEIRFSESERTAANNLSTLNEECQILFCKQTDESKAPSDSPYDWEFKNGEK